MSVDRSHWLNHVKSVVRSRHYYWLPQGLGGEPVDEAMTYLTTDIMHVCKMAGVPFAEVLGKARDRCESEELELAPGEAPVTPTESTPVLDGEEVVAIYVTDDLYDAEIIRSRLQHEGIPCLLDGSSQGGFIDLVDIKLLVHAKDADRARSAINNKATNVNKVHLSPAHNETRGWHEPQSRSAHRVQSR